MAKLYELETRAHRSAFDSLLPEDVKVFAYFEDDDREELKLMVLEEA